MRVLCEIRILKEGIEGDDDAVYENRKFILWHFGMAIEHYTIAICEDCETGQIKCFLPESLRIIGKEIKK